VHIDFDPSSINKIVPVDLAIVADAGLAVRALLDRWRARKLKADAARLAPWWDQIKAWQARDCLRYRQDGTTIKPQYAIQRLYELTRDRETFITTEVGQHQMWAAQHYKFEAPRHWMTSGGLGTMGYGFPSAMGVQVAHPDALVIDIAGEASWVMNMQEMSTLVQYRLPVKSFILNNSYMGMVRQWQEFFHGNRYSESYMDSLPDFVKLAEAFGAVGLRAETPDQVDDVIRAMIDTPKPVIADIVVDRAENVYPMIPGGAAHNEIKLCPEDDAPVQGSEEGMILV
jgi:acetolactate synthase-1/2/3 large subunit